MRDPETHHSPRLCLALTSAWNWICSVWRASAASCLWYMSSDRFSESVAWRLGTSQNDSQGDTCPRRITATSWTGAKVNPAVFVNSKRHSLLCLSFCFFLMIPEGAELKSHLPYLTAWKKSPKSPRVGLKNITLLFWWKDSWAEQRWGSSSIALMGWLRKKRNTDEYLKRKKERNDKQSLVAQCAAPTMTHCIVLENTLVKRLKWIWGLLIFLFWFFLCFKMNICIMFFPSTWHKLNLLIWEGGEHDLLSLE